MILIAPDKFKGTLSAAQAADIISRELTDSLMCPMADGGEGTAQVIASTQPGWEQRPGWYFHPATATAAIDSSAVIGPAAWRDTDPGIMRRDSAALGHAVKAILHSGAAHVLIGIGGTFTCDGGEGFLRALGPEPLGRYRERITGLSDVRVPLIAPIGEPSALMFAPQKGAAPQQLPALAERLARVRALYGGESTYDGAGGGLGYAIASAIGARCVSGAEYVMELYRVPWDQISLVVTGEGRIDSQTARGKVVCAVASEAARHGIPTVAIGGSVEPGATLGPDIPADRMTIISTDQYLAAEPLTPEVAARRLALAARSIRAGSPIFVNAGVAYL